MQWIVRRTPEKGLTLIELLITLTLASIILIVGIPAFQRFAAGNVQSAEINNLVRHINLARSEAVKSGRNHVICPSLDLGSCLDSAHWELGFIIFQDRNENGIREEDEPLLRANRPTTEVDIVMESTRRRKQIVFRPDGRSSGSNLTITFCDPENALPPRAVIVSNAGRARVAKTHWDGSPLDCGDG